ncbi:MAG: response regulator [Bacteroidales bacterium]|nr:response regulator [Bacteroidales bacterium]MBN2817738.1 response regulator [Bacteroidales bacterium]
MDRKAIICIDDEPIILNSLVEQLEKHFGIDYIYEAAESAEEALDLIDDLEDEEIDIEIIVCDWLMPGMKGDEFLLRMDLKYPRVVKILLTGQADEALVYNLKQEADKFAIVHKPWEKDEIIHAIKQRMIK